MGKATWRMVWVQLLGWGVISTILGLLAGAVFTSIGFHFYGYLSPEAMQELSARSASYGGIISIPLGFFLWMGLVYLLAKAFNGQRTFLTQSYATLLFQVPLGILGSTLGMIPYLGLLGLAVFICGIVLQVFALMATHRLSGGKQGHLGRLLALCGDYAARDRARDHLRQCADCCAPFVTNRRLVPRLPAGPTTRRPDPKAGA